MLTDLNYDGYSLKDYKQEVIEKYAFPKDKRFILKVMKGEQYYTKEEYELTKRDVVRDWEIIMISSLIGIGAYVYLKQPAGYVLRQQRLAKMPLPKKYLLQLLTFLGLGVPVYILRRQYDTTLDYKD